MNKIKILKAGLLTTVQDIGRTGYQQYGMPVSGVMDTLSYNMANYLVGNTRYEACLEITATGPEIEFESDTYIAICGADMEPRLNNLVAGMYKTILVKAGDILSFKGLKKGFRVYIAFAGGINVPCIMGSRSTYLYGKTGGFKGRALKAGDVLELLDEPREICFKEIPEEKIPQFNSHITAHIIGGPEAYCFPVNDLAKFLDAVYSVSPESSRMGFRLDGVALKHNGSADIISSGITFGTIQIPANGKPIIMMADRQTTGGYTRIANVITADLPYVAQLKPGDTIRFKEVKIDKAISILKKQFST